MRSAAREGVVVYIMRSISILDFLCLDFLIKRFGLPLVRFANDLGLWILEPFGKGGRRLRFRRQLPEDDALAQTIKESFSALLFLRAPPGLGRSSRKGGQLDVDLIRSLVETQRKIDKPILLVPQTFVWRIRPANARHGITDLFFGTVEWPGRLRRFFQFIFNYRNARLRSGEAFNVAEFLDANQSLTDTQAADKIRYVLLRRIERERKIVLGPTKKTVGRIQGELLRSPRVRKHLKARSKQKGVSLEKTEGEARKVLARLCANQQSWTLRVFAKMLGFVFSRIYDGIVIDEEGVERLRAAMRKGGVVLMPSHKSHIDYLVLSYVLHENGLACPLIAAGDNLNFWPLGAFLRRGGAFFIKRSFKGNKLYAALVDAYMRKALVEGFPIEFFIEGGRSRTGKLLSPKFGLLSMVIDAAEKLKGRDVTFVPVSIDYERVVEERAYVHELGGGEKQKENVSGLLRAPKILQSRYGRLYVNFAEHIDFRDTRNEVCAQDQDQDQEQLHEDSLTSATKRHLVRRIARETLHHINSVSMVSPAALMASALLQQRRRTVSREALLKDCDRLLFTAKQEGARIAEPLASEAPARRRALNEAIGLFVNSGLVRPLSKDDQSPLHIPETRRPSLEYYKNNILHFFYGRALISNAIVHRRQFDSNNTMEVDDVIRRAQSLSERLSHELVMDDGFKNSVDLAHESALRETIAKMEAAEELSVDEQQVLVADVDAVSSYASMLKTYFESYLLALNCLPAESESMSKKDWVKKGLSVGQRMYLSGEITLRESVAKPKLEAVHRALQSEHILSKERRTVRLHEAFEATQVETLRAQLTALLNE